MIVIYHRDFKKDYRKLPKKIIKRFEERILLFVNDEFNPVLNNHSLKGKYSSYRSINVTGDLRAVYKKDGENAIFVAIDSHSNLYD